jgi:putative NADH-flavin reductase
MNITILGTRGKTGAELVRQALAAGHTVNGVVRADGGVEEHPGLNLIVGDATNAEVIARASTGSDLIISALGATSSRPSLMTDAVASVITASTTTGVKRFILMSSFVVERDRLQGLLKLITATTMQNMTKDKAASETALRDSDLEWTIVYPTRLTNQRKGSGVRVLRENERIGLRYKVARADVAAWMLEEAEHEAYCKKNVTISQ